MSKIEAPSKASRTKVSAEAKAQGILVLGMHRSGTSACTRVLNLMGCALPDDLMAAADSNETGHWESNDVVALNDEMLLTAGSSWQDWGPVNADWRESGIRNSMLAKATVLIKTHAALGPLFAVKDPRMCRLADVWVDAMAAAAVEPCIIIMLRNPAEVKESLESRDLTAPDYGELLWLRHVLDAEYFTRGQRRTFCRYDQLLANWQGMMSRVKSDLGIVFPRNSPMVHAQIEKFLSRAHRHHDANAQSVLANPGYSEWLQRTFAIMLDWSETGESSADYSNLDAIRHEFDRAYAAFARLVMADDIKGEVGAGSRLKRELNIHLEEAQRAAEAIQFTLRQTEAETAVAVAREAELSAQLTNEATRAEEFRREIEKLQIELARLSDVESEAEQLRLHEADLTAKLGMAESTLLQTEAETAVAVAREAELSAQLTNEATRAEEFRREIEKLQIELARLSDVESEAEQLRLHEADLTAKLGMAESTLLQRQEELDQTWSQIKTAERALAEASSNVTHERERRQDSDKRVAILESELSELRKEIDKSGSAAVSLADKFVFEIAQLTKMLRDHEQAMQTVIAARSTEELKLMKLSDENERLADQIQQLETGSQQAETARSTIEKKLAARFDEIARMTAMLADESRRATSAHDDLQWLRDVQRVANGFPSWWVLLRDDKRRKREHQRYYRAGLFDARRYLDRYPDVLENGMDPVRHYILHGMAEGRQRTTPS